MNSSLIVRRNGNRAVTGGRKIRKSYKGLQVINGVTDASFTFQWISSVLLKVQRILSGENLLKRWRVSFQSATLVAHKSVKTLLKNSNCLNKLQTPELSQHGTRKADN